MKFLFNSQKYGRIFAVPSSVVKEHIRLSGAVQLKVLLWLLYNAPDTCTTEQLSRELGFSTEDINDAVQYWIVNGFVDVCNDSSLIVVNENKNTESTTSDNNILNNTESENIDYSDDKYDDNDFNASADASFENYKSENCDKKELETSVKPATVKKSVRTPVKNLTRSEAIALGKSNPEIAWLLNEAQNVFARPLSSTELSLIVSFNLNDGLPASVVLMLLQYAATFGKLNVRYLNKVAGNWADLEIDSVEKAEALLKQLELNASAWKTAERIFGITKRSPSAKEQEAVTRWLIEWNFSPEMLKYAYDQCVDHTGSLNFRYINTTLKRCRDEGISTPDIAEKNNNNHKATSKSKSTSQKKPEKSSSFKISDIEDLFLRPEPSEITDNKTE